MTRRRPFGTRLIGGERGAVATLVAVLVAGGLVMGMLALSVDVGNAMYERRQIQNGADAAALALAQDCAKGTAGCSPNAQPDLQTLAGRNAADQRTDVTEICANPAGIGGLGPCPGPATDYVRLPECLPLPAGFTGSYVEARTRTRTTGGQTILPKYFSQLLVGGGPDVTVAACARAGWGPLGSTRRTIPLVVGVCNWQEATKNGFAPSPPYTPGPSPSTAVPSSLVTYITTIFGQVNGSETTVLQSKICLPDISAPPSGGYTPGGFGWVKTCADLGSSAPPECDGADPCTAVFNATGTVDASTGASLPNECHSALQNYVGQEVDIPVITSVAGNGGNAIYTVTGLASFYLAGYKNIPSALPNPGDLNAYKANVPSYSDMTCFPWKSSCLWGWFTSPLRPVGSLAPGGVPSRGPVVVAPAG